MVFSDTSLSKPGPNAGTEQKKPIEAIAAKQRTVFIALCQLKWLAAARSEHHKLLEMRAPTSSTRELGLFKNGAMYAGEITHASAISTMGVTQKTIAEITRGPFIYLVFLLTRTTGVF